MRLPANNFPSATAPQTSSSSTPSFQPPKPLQSHGHPVFPKVPIRNHASTNDTVGNLQNNSPDAVFVVNGSSRGIGLQLILTLAQCTRGAVVAFCRLPADNSLRSIKITFVRHNNHGDVRASKRAQQMMAMMIAGEKTKNKTTIN